MIIICIYVYTISSGIYLSYTYDEIEIKLREFVSKSLNPYMISKFLVIINEYPFTGEYISTNIM